MKKKKIIFAIVLFFIFIFLIKIFLKKETNIDKNTHYFYSQNNCIKNPEFIKEKIGSNKVSIDLTQKKIKGVAFLYNKKSKTNYYFGENWDKKGSFRDYARDKDGNIYLTPVIFMEASKEVFKRQNSIFKIDSKTGKLEKFMEIKGNEGTAKNPFGLSSIVYDCETDSLFVGSLANSTAKEEKGKIYKIDLKTKKIISKYKNTDALSMLVIKNNNKQNFLMYGSAKKNNLYLLELDKNKNFKNNKPLSITIPAKKSKSFDKIYRIRFKQKNIFELKGVEFNYTSLASTNSERNFYTMIYNNKKNKFKIVDYISEYNLFHNNDVKINNNNNNNNNNNK